MMTDGIPRRTRQRESSKSPGTDTGKRLKRQRTGNSALKDSQVEDEFSVPHQTQSRLEYLASFPEVNPNPVAGLKVDGSVQYVNPAAQQLFPDLQDMGPRHKWLVGLNSIVNLLTDTTIPSYIREIEFGNAWFEQIFFLTPMHDQIRIYGRDITKRKRAEEERERLIHSLQDALAKIRRLHGMLPICASCKKIRDDKGYWNQIESYIQEHSEAEFTHGICPDCMKKLYGLSLDKDGKVKKE